MKQDSNLPNNHTDTFLLEISNMAVLGKATQLSFIKALVIYSTPRFTRRTCSAASLKY